MLNSKPPFYHPILTKRGNELAWAMCCKWSNEIRMKYFFEDGAGI